MEMKVINIYKAQETNGEEVTPICIETTEVFPGCVTLEGQRQLTLDDARKLLTALKSALPGGTYDRLFALMAADVASDLVISKE